MRSKLVKIVDIDGNVYGYNGVKRACEECHLPIGYGIYPHRAVPRKYEDNFRKIALVVVNGIIRYEFNK